jgi:NADH-quinone oxidoreductase subunit B
MAFGACATSGGSTRTTRQPGTDKIIPVDIYVPGCPPRPETVIDAIMMLQDRIARSHHPILTGTF